MRRFRPYFFLACSLILLFSLFRYPQINQKIQSTFLTCFKPFLTVGSSLRSTLLVLRNDHAFFWNALTTQDKYLERIAFLESRLTQYEETREENERLRELLNFSESLSVESVGARIIGEDLSPWRRAVLLDKGTRHGIRKDMPIVVPGGFVGRMIQVSPLTSKAILLTDSDSRVSIVTVESRSQGIVVGRGNKKLEVKYLPLDSQIKVGETVVTSGRGGFFPQGLRIGTIESVRKGTDGLHLLATVKPSVHFSKLEEVVCLVWSREK